MTNTRYVDSQGVHRIYPASTSKRYREMKRAVDPFPPGKMIGGKRYWLVEEVLDWLERQDDPPPFNPMAAKVEPREAEPEADNTTPRIVDKPSPAKAVPRHTEPAGA